MSICLCVTLHILLHKCQKSPFFLCVCYCVRICRFHCRALCELEGCSNTNTQRYGPHWRTNADAKGLKQQPNECPAWTRENNPQSLVDSNSQSPKHAVYDSLKNRHHTLAQISELDYFCPCFWQILPRHEKKNVFANAFLEIVYTTFKLFDDGFVI